VSRQVGEGLRMNRKCDRRERALGFQ
jgi:hypothetical protein